MSTNARLLAHYELPTTKRKTLVPVEFAQELARSMRAEKLSARLYRLFPPDSIFTPAKDFPQTHHEIERPIGLPSSELPGIRYRRANPGAFATARRADAIAAISAYVWG